MVSNNVIFFIQIPIMVLCIFYFWNKLEFLLNSRKQLNKRVKDLEYMLARLRSDLADVRTDLNKVKFDEFQRSVKSEIKNELNEDAIKKGL